MGDFFRRILYLLNCRRRQRELAEELEFHREMMERDGRRNFGDPLRLREESRDAWGWLWFDWLGQDLIYGARVLRRAPAFTLSAALILALGIGVNLAAFQLFNAAVLKPLPVRDPDTLVRFIRRHPGGMSTNVPYPAMEFYRRHNTVLSAVLGITTGRFGFGDDPADQINVKLVTANYFTELGAAPLYGRAINPATDAASASEPVALLNYGFWQRRFGANPAVIGTTIRLNRKPVTIVGVLPRDFTGLQPGYDELWLPIEQVPYLVEGSDLLSSFAVGGPQMYGRLKPGIPAKAAEDSLAILAAEHHRQQPDYIHENERLVSLPGAYLASLDMRHAQPQEWLLFGMIVSLFALILVITCANLANLQLARGVARAHEIFIRRSLGAGRARIVFQLMTESILLALLGALAGLWFSKLGLGLLLRVTEGPTYLRFQLDTRIVLFTVAIAVLAAVLFGLAPALRVTRPGSQAHHARRVLIGAQVAASCVLLIVSALLVRSLHSALVENPGFEYKRLLTLAPGLSTHGYQQAGAAAYWEELKLRLEKIPGIESVSLATVPPRGNLISSRSGPQPVLWRAYSNDVDPNFFLSLGIPILRGRTFTLGEKNVVIVSEMLARRVWPGQDPIGKELGSDVVVGVVAPARIVALSEGDAAEAYYPLRQDALGHASLVVKSRAEPEALAGQLLAAALAADPKSIPQVTLLKDAFRQRMRSSETAATVVSALGLLAALLASAGVYGQVCYSVSQRQKEIGIRKALGADNASILGLILHQFYGPVGAGMIVGIGAAAGLSVVLRQKLFGLSHLDPLSYAGAIVFLLVLAGLAALLPARRALRVDPSEVLRYERRGISSTPLAVPRPLAPDDSFGVPKSTTQVLLHSLAPGDNLRRGSFFTSWPVAPAADMAMGIAARDIDLSNRRRSTRVVISIPVVLSGTTKQGQAFREEARTLIVNKHGAKVVFSHRLEEHAQIRIENPANKISCAGRVIWASEQATADGRFELGISFYEPIDLWGIDFPPDDWREPLLPKAQTPPAPEASHPLAAVPSHPAPATVPPEAKPASPQAETMLQAELERFRAAVAKIVEEARATTQRDLQQLVARIVQDNAEKFSQEARSTAAEFAERLEHEANAAIERASQTLGSRLRAALSNLEPAPGKPEPPKPRK